MKVTVFTPTYNRAYIINSLYRSLRRQTVTDFEWIVIDDGSTDNTQELFEQIKADKKEFSLIYKKVPNGGKHRAINKGVQIASGELFFIVDSDDYLCDNAIERIIEVENSIPKNTGVCYAGVAGLRGYSTDKIIGSTFEGDFLDITSLERPKYHVTGDKAEVFYTSILKQYPFPEFDGENFVTECVVWDRIAFDGYKLRFFNDIIYICDYLPDGLTAQGDSLLDRNPRGKGVYIYQRGKFGVTFGVKKWEEIWKYYHQFKNSIPIKEMAGLLHLSPMELRLRIFGMKVFYKLYDR